MAQLRNRKGVEIDDVHDQIHEGADGQAAEQGTGEVSAGLADLARHVDRRIPAEKAEEDR
jgi:hypothetical protein